MYKEVKFTELSNEALDQLTRGAFLSVKSGEISNTMTIGWGALGYMWGKPVFMAMVRLSRYTYELMENADDFTVSLPTKDSMKEELGFCGRISGRDCNKFKECSLNLKEGDTTQSPLIEGCKLYLECRTIYKQQMTDENLDKALKDRWYGDDDYHVMYYGEITKAYIKE